MPETIEPGDDGNLIMIGKMADAEITDQLREMGKQIGPDEAVIVISAECVENWRLSRLPSPPDAP